jgi:hypothetical protein
MADESQPKTLTRRDFQLGVVSAATSVAVGCQNYRPVCPTGGGVALDDPFDGYEPLFLSKGQLQTLAAATEAMVADCPLVVSAPEVAKRADQYLAASRAPQAERIKLALTAVEAATSIWFLKVESFTNLDVAKRREVIEDMVRSRGLTRDMARVLKMFTTFPYYTHPNVRRAFGFVDFERRPRFNPLPVFTQRLTYPEPAEFGGSELGA